MRLLSRLSPISLAVCLVGCSNSGIALRESPPDPGAKLPQGFLDASSETSVPSEVLFALARAETNFQMVQGTSEFEDQEPAFGITALREPFLSRAAELAGLDVEEVKTDQISNLLAAGHLLRDWGLEADIDFEDIDAWAPIIAYYSGIEDPEGAAEYVHHEVYGALRLGIEIEGFALPPMAVDPNYPLPQRDLERGRDTSTIWTPSPNYNSRGSSSADFVIIHTCEGSYSSCWSWLSNSASGVSAHYVVNDSGSEVRSLVDESNRAWHISASYDCDNNSDVECWRDGTSMNTISVGIEHAGYSSQSSWNPGLIQRSAELTCGITERNDIPRDSYHIVGHGQLQPWNRTDPGPNWPWSTYLATVQSECGDTSAPPPSSGSGSSSSAPGTQFVIDSNNTANVTSQYYIEVSSSWWASTSASGYWNTGYWVGPTASVSDAASFWFHIDSPQCYTVEAWWTASSNRPAAVTFMGWEADDSEVGRATVSQQVNGGRWNRLGDWEFTSTGWNRILLSRWTTSGYYAIADAVRLTPSSSCP